MLEWRPLFYACCSLYEGVCTHRNVSLTYCHASPFPYPSTASGIAMNLILLGADDLIAPDHARVTDPRRLRHLREVHRATVGDEMTLGIEGGVIGRGRLESIDAESAEFSLRLEHAPPPPLNVHLLLALPRPRMLARSLEHVTALGVKHITLLHTRRVEKSYWQSPELGAEKIRQHLILGLEQARDTIMPTVTQEKLFKPFVEDRLPDLMTPATRGIIAHPGMVNACPRAVSEPIMLAIGPEGGFVDYEVEQFLSAGFQGVHLGERILRVETAVTALLARLG